MYRGLTYTVIFAVGAAVGSLVTWKTLDSKYKQILKEEEAAIREYYEGKYEEAEEETINENDTEDFIEDKIEEAKNILKENGYTTDEKIKREDELMKPYVIEPEELGELDGYDVESLIYYNDGVLANDIDERIDDIDDVVGEESLTHFGEYEEDTVCVRNDRLKIDFEICRDLRNYSDVVPFYPLGEDE